MRSIIRTHPGLVGRIQHGVAGFGLTLRLLLLLAASILPAMAALVYIQFGLRHERSDRMAESALHHAQLLSAEIETLIDGARQLTETVAQVQRMRPPGSGCDDMLGLLRQTLHGYALLQITGPDGGALCSAGEPGGSELRLQVAGAIAGRHFVVGRYSGAGPVPLLPMILPFKLAAGTTGAVVAAIDLGWLQQHVHRFRTFASTSLNVSDANGTILVRFPDPGRWAGHQVAAAARPLVQAAAAGTVTLTGVDGVQRVVGYVPAPLTGGLYVAYGLYVPDMLVSIDRAANRGYVLVAVCSALSLLLMMLITRRLVHAPTDALLDAAQRWGNGDLAARARPRVSEENEFGRLAAAFNFMAEALDARRRQLEELNASLEGRVAERTHALSQTNNRLLVEIAERERTDAALRKAQQLQAVGHLAGGMAHEFNNINTTVIGALDLLRLRLPADEALQRYILPALEAAQRGARMTSQLLAFARRRRLLPVAVDLNAVIGEMRELLRGTLQRGIELRLELAEGLWPALADRHEIEAAILNLVLNARDALGTSGILRLATRNAALPGHDPASGSPDCVELVVEDNGAGMSEQELAHAINPFFTTKAPGHGAGLGLSQVHGIVQQLGGDLQIASVLGSGTTVSLFLPRAQASAPVPIRARATPQAASTLPVLLVDDDCQVRAVAGEMLTELGYAVTQASSGEHALDLLQRGSYAVLVVDYAMPGMSGLELIHKARTIQPSQVVLLITGYMELDCTDGPDLTPRQVLRKPFTLRELAERVAELSRECVPAPA